MVRKGAGSVDAKSVSLPWDLERVWCTPLRDGEWIVTRAGVEFEGVTIRLQTVVWKKSCCKIFSDVKLLDVANYTTRDLLETAGPSSKVDTRLRTDFCPRCFEPKGELQWIGFILRDLFLIPVGFRVSV